MGQRNVSREKSGAGWKDGGGEETLRSMKWKSKYFLSRFGISFEIFFSWLSSEYHKHSGIDKVDVFCIGKNC